MEGWSREELTVTSCPTLKNDLQDIKAVVSLPPLKSCVASSLVNSNLEPHWEGDSGT